MLKKLNNNFMLDFFKTLQISGFPVKEARKEYQKILVKYDILSWQDAKKYEIVRFHLQDNDFYKQFAKGWNGEWENLPIITNKDLLGNHFDKLPPKGNSKYFISQTSGSSGQPFVFVKDRFTHVLTWLNVAAHYSRAGISINDLQARFYGISLVGTKFLKEKFKDFLSHRRRFNVFNLNDDALADWLNQFRKHSFQYLYGYTNSLLAFARFLIRNQIVLKQVCPGLKACIVTAEVCTQQDNLLLETGFGIPVFNEYGASETGIIGFGQKQNWLASDELVYLEVVDDYGNLVPDGTPGRLLCTLFHNKGTPIIRYEVGDNASIKHFEGKTYIENLRGRLSDFVTLPSGKVVPGLTFYYLVQEVLNKTDFCSEYRVVAISNRDMEIQMVSDEEISQEIEKSLQHVVGKYLESGLNVKVKRVPEISRTGMGKFKNFVKL
jgi:phenylacetate-CoA ligase